MTKQVFDQIATGLREAAETPPAWAMEKVRETFFDAKWMADDALKSRVKEGAFDDDPHLLAIAHALAEADKAATEKAAKYHDDQIANLKAQIAANDAYKLRSGHQDNSANDYCRTLIITHRLSAAAIRGASK